MKPHEVTPENMHLAVALIVERQASFFDLHEKHGESLLEIKAQVTKTNGRVNAHDEDIAFLKREVASGDLEKRTRSLEDAAIRSEGKREGMSLVAGAMWAVGGTAVSGALLWLFQNAK